MKTLGYAVVDKDVSIAHMRARGDLLPSIEYMDEVYPDHAPHRLEELIAKSEAEALVKNAERYEYVRALTPSQFKKIWEESLRKAIPFDDLIDAALSEHSQPAKEEM